MIQASKAKTKRCCPLRQIRWKWTETEFVNLLRSPGIDSHSSGPVRQPYLTRYRPARLHRLESIPGLLERLQIRTQAHHVKSEARSFPIYFASFQAWEPFKITRHLVQLLAFWNAVANSGRITVNRKESICSKLTNRNRHFLLQHNIHIDRYHVKSILIDTLDSVFNAAKIFSSARIFLIIWYAHVASTLSSCPRYCTCTLNSRIYNSQKSSWFLTSVVPYVVL
jgi:hypothetical protein